MNLIKQKKDVVLSNGLRILVFPIPQAKTATSLLMTKTGSRYEDRKENGLSHFLEHLFFKGSKRWPDALSLAQKLDSLGGEYNAFTSKEYTGYYAKVAGGRLNSALDVLADMLLNPIFPEEEIEREKGVVIEEVKMYQDNPLMSIEDVFETCLFGDHPLGWEVIGTIKNIKSFNREILFDYYQRQYGANSLNLILSGAVSFDDLKKAQDLFSKATINKWQDKKTLKNLNQENIRIVNKKIDQVNLSLGFKAWPIAHPLEKVAKLIALILGGSMSSRMFVNIREQKGLAYYIKTVYEQYVDTGYITTQAGVPKNKVAEAVALITKEYQNLIAEKVSDKEVERVKDMAISRLKMRLESSDDLANWYGRQVLNRQKLITPQAYIREFKKINSRDIFKAAKLLFQQKKYLALIGNISSKEKTKISKYL
jgi:predicted Zn-dependent peptidase